MKKIYLLSNTDLKYVNFLGICSLCLVAMSVFYDIYATYLYMKDEHKRSEIFRICSRWTYRPALMLLIMWGVFTLINQVNGWIEILNYF